MTTYTPDDFETALVAKHPDGRVAIRGRYDCAPWFVQLSIGGTAWMYDAELADIGFIPAVLATTPREALDAAWDRAYELPEDAVIPAGTPIITRWENDEMTVFPRGQARDVSAHGPCFERRLLDAPAPARPEGAAQYTEHPAIGIEKGDEYLPLIRHRLERADPRIKVAKPAEVHEDQLDMLALLDTAA